jgi:prepilin-type N-terminal cleavage/methylation domain-containing protein/prepilin-type processing-associated H-X9-DG protein
MTDAPLALKDGPRPPSGAPMKTHSRAFTLIELLVVIAIIAILAAILFPVFAQAKAAAKSSADLSNEKQITLGHLIYAGDNDDAFAEGFTWESFASWPVRVQPYIKSIGLFKSPLDGKPLTDPNGWGVTEGGWMGVGISVAANNYMIWDGNLGGFSMHGVITSTTNNWSASGGIRHSLVSTQVTQPAATILLADKFNSVVEGIRDAEGDSPYEFNSSGAFGNWFTFSGYDSVRDGSAVPDGTSTDTRSILDGKNGGVSTNGTTGRANFAFVDGHCKNANPASTNPDPWGRPQDNLWDALR